jgi:tetratricopeptide (TPR) repeat protein
MARHEEALPDLEFAAEMDSNYAEPRVLLAQAYSELGRYDDAIAVLEHVLERQPDHQAALDAMSRVEMQMAADGVVR